MTLLEKLDKMQTNREKTLEAIAKKSGRDLSTITNYLIQRDVFRAQMDNLQSDIEYFSK